MSHATARVTLMSYTPSFVLYTILSSVLGLGRCNTGGWV